MRFLAEGDQSASAGCAGPPPLRNSMSNVIQGRPVALCQEESYQLSFLQFVISKEVVG
jgi:hypothetical protein